MLFWSSGRTLTTMTFGTSNHLLAVKASHDHHHKMTNRQLFYSATFEIHDLENYNRRQWSAIQQSAELDKKE